MQHLKFYGPLLAIAFAGMAGSAALAQEASSQRERRASPGHGKDAFVRESDMDGDGRVTSAEFAAARAAKHRTFDLDGDGKVSEADYVGEFTGRMGKKAKIPEGQLKQAHVRFGVLDTDKDGNLTLAEFNASGERMFAKLDSNGDGVVDAKDTSKSY